jgi:hypothetical protein
VLHPDISQTPLEKQGHFPNKSRTRYGESLKQKVESGKLKAESEKLNSS